MFHVAAKAAAPSRLRTTTACLEEFGITFYRYARYLRDIWGRCQGRYDKTIPRAGVVENRWGLSIMVAMAGRFRRVEQISAGRRLTAASYAAPHEGKIFGTVEVDVSEALRFLEHRSAEGVRLSMTHLVVRATALILRDTVPELNQTIRRGRLYQRPSIDIFLSIALKKGRELSGFKIERADTKSLEEIAAEIKDVALRMRRGDETLGVVRTQRLLQAVPAPLLRPALQILRLLVVDWGLNLSPLGLPEDPFGSLLITEIGSYGLGVGFPALLPLSGASCIIAIGQVSQRAVVRDGEVVARPMLPLSATFDHRIADAYHAGALVRAAQKLLEHPEQL